MGTRRDGEAALAEVAVEPQAASSQPLPGGEALARESRPRPASSPRAPCPRAPARCSASPGAARRGPAAIVKPARQARRALRELGAAGRLGAAPVADQRQRRAVPPRRAARINRIRHVDPTLKAVEHMATMPTCRSLPILRREPGRALAAPRPGCDRGAGGYAGGAATDSAASPSGGGTANAEIGDASSSGLSRPRVARQYLGASSR